MKTLYYRATHRQSFELASDFLDVGHESLLPPTVMAVRDGMIIGVLGTTVMEHSEGDMVITGPLKVEVDGSPMFVARRLIEKYEQEALRLGLKTLYFYVDSEHQWKRYMDRQPEWLPVTEVNGRSWYKRVLYSEEQAGGS